MIKKTHEYQLKNGLKLIVKEDRRSPIAIFQIFYKVGSSYENNGCTGVSHALEHMMFNGTKNDPNSKFLKIISSYGGQQNAYTTNDYTAYYEIMNKNNLSYSFKLEADRMQNLLLSQKKFLKEIEVIMEERRMSIDDNPQRFTLERFFAIAYLSSPYRYPIIGWMDDLKNMTVFDLRNWYNRWYSPNNAVVVVVGDVKPIEVHQLAKKYFGQVKPKKISAPKPQEEIEPTGARTCNVQFPAKLPWFVIGFNAPTINTAKEKWEPHALLLLCEILAGNNSARLQKKIVRKKSLAINVSYYYTPFSRLNSVLAIFATPINRNSVENLRKNLFFEIEQLQKNYTPKNELDRIKVNFIAEKVYHADSISHQAHEIGSFESVGLSWKEIDKTYKAIESITAEQIKKVACKYLTLDRLIITKLDPLPLKRA